METEERASSAPAPPEFYGRPPETAWQKIKKFLAPLGVVGALFIKF